MMGYCRKTTRVYKPRKTPKRVSIRVWIEEADAVLAEDLARITGRTMSFHFREAWRLYAAEYLVSLAESAEMLGEGDPLDKVKRDVP